MRARFKVPADFYVVGPETSSLDLEVAFDYKSTAGRLKLGMNDPLSASELPVSRRQFARVHHLEITLNEEEEAGLATKIQEQDWLAVVTDLRKIANRCIRAIRNFGMVPGLQELRKTEDEPQEVLKAWKLELENGDQWDPVFPEDRVMGILGAMLGSNSSQILGEFWHGSFPSVVEAIQDDVDPPPEQEFTTNAIEHLRRGNFRFALLESVIGLEIVLARYLTSYLRVRKEVPPGRIKTFISPDLGLTARVGGLLELTLPRDLLRKIELDRVPTAVNWRNRVVHRTGRLPEGIPDDTLRETIGSVIALTNIVAGESATVEAEPEMLILARELATMIPDLPRPSVKYLGDHDVGVWLRKVTLDQIWKPERELIEEVIRLAARVRGTQDKRFSVQANLRIAFETIPWNKVTIWRGGNLTVPGN